jgi:outer membrane protein OmpA-like peptidoglycan-associated protein
MEYRRGMRIATMVLAALVASCGGRSTKPSQLALKRVILYQNGIGFFERTGHVGSDRIVLAFARHEVDDVLKTLTVIDQRGASVATVDVPPIAEDDRTVPIGVRMTGGGVHDILVSYAVPTPTWKPAYRVVLDEAGVKPTGLLQGWAVVDNASPEDWTGVRLTLATGAPMSYALDLHTPKYVERPDITGKMVAPAVLGPVGAEKAGAGAGDRDGDGIANADDLCPDEPEDKDGFEDEDGCPDPDNDKDRILDRDDKCPNEPETYNGFEDEDGCPDRGRVVVTDTAIEILDMIYFARGKDTLEPRSLPIVDATAATLNGNPSIKLIEIQGHAATNEPNAFKIADRRAAAVKAALIARGVDPLRLTEQGYGATQPLDRRTDENAHAKNRRVAFLILKRSNDDPPPRPRATPTPVLDTRTAAASVKTATRPVEVAGTVRYELAEPVTVRRGSSTMVSILNKQVTAEDAYLWRPDANAPGSDRHPFRVVRLENGSGYTLQPGPVAIFARGTFVGDGLLDQLDRDETAWVPYALDSSTRVTVEIKRDERPARIVAIDRGVLSVENTGSVATRYAVAAGREPARRMFLRHAKASGYVADELPPGTIDQGDAYLLPLPLSPEKASELTIVERQPRRRTLQLLYAKPADVELYVEGSQLPPGVGDKLREAIVLRKQLSAIEDEVRAIRERNADVTARAQELRENLRALDKVRGTEDLRKKLVARLTDATVEADKLAKELVTRTEAQTAVRANLQDALRDLVLEEPKP